MKNKLRALWDDGYTVDVIAGILGISRNAIVSKRRRMNLVGRESPIIRDGKLRKDGRPSRAKRAVDHHV